jgi:hypothetical protein
VPLSTASHSPLCRGVKTTPEQSTASLVGHSCQALCCRIWLLGVKGAGFPSASGRLSRRSEDLRPSGGGRRPPEALRAAHRGHCLMRHRWAPRPPR